MPAKEQPEGQVWRPLPRGWGRVPHHITVEGAVGGGGGYQNPLRVEQTPIVMMAKVTVSSVAFIPLFI